jgi:CTP:molybdopterin cytidylyltransferase MocA
MPNHLLVAILAAGASRRLGQPKQLVMIDGETLLRHQCRMALETQVGKIVVILGCHADRCGAVIADLPVSTRLNDAWSEGLSSSIRIATRAAIEANAAGLLILHGDQYRLTSQDLQKLHAAWSLSQCLSACRSRYEDYAGPPVILPASSFNDALNLQGDEGARRVLNTFAPDSLIDVAIPNAVHDLDSPAQLPTANTPA